MKKILSLVLSVIMLLTVFPTFQVFAAKEPTFVVSNAKGEVGDTVDITISLKNNTGIVSMFLLVDYDMDALKLLSYTEKDFNGVTYGPKTKTPFHVTWIDPLSPDNDTNGVLATLTFEILDTAPNGKSDITVTYDPENVFKLDPSARDGFANVYFAVENGYVDINNPNPKPVTSQKDDPTANESVVASVDEETNQIYEQVIEDMLNDPDNIPADEYEKAPNATESSETTGDVNKENAVDNDNNGDTEKNDGNADETSNGWLIWVVVAAVVVLLGAFAVVIIKGKKSKH